MTTEEFNEIMTEFQNEDIKVGTAKGNDYTMQNPDRLHNFKSIGELVHCPHCSQPIGARAVWLIYFLKHIWALISWANTGKVESEGLKGRFVDTRIYSVLGYGISQEQDTPKEHNKTLEMIIEPIIKNVEKYCNLKNHDIGKVDYRKNG